ncbi:MAG: carboxypeptidase-like regulatory domain-containing protein, partial [Ignavibacteriae bacterium]|nr:carboxypeptidase-like regulatory domain-containing protein [Ignavibacteriota bacterium]
MKNILTLIIIIIISCGYTYSQTINGIVYGSNVKGRETLEGASIKWINTKKGALTGSEGKFELYPEGITDRRVIVSYVGYTPDTVDVSKKSFVEIELKSSFSTQQIVVEDEQKSSFISNDNSKTEVITQMELKKDACCDLSGCFGKNASVDVAVTDILTNTKELKVLGLEGSYTQILIDNMPIMTGLVTKYGVTSIPGTLVNKINISKGSNSVLQGYESISGIMNVLLKDYGTSDRLLVNGFINSGLEKQFNVNGTAMVKKNLSTIAAFQTVQEMKRMDENGDGFLDVPLTRRYMFYNKWRYGSSEEDKTSVMVGLKYLNERRVGGQKGFNYDTDLGSGIIYGQTVNLENGDIYGRISRVLKNENQIKLFTSGGFFNQDSYYGTTNYTAKQRDFYFNGLYEFEVYKKSFLRFGASYRYENIDENVRFLAEVPKTYAGNYEKLESIPGVFTEASFEQKDLNLSVIAGLRLDFHNKYNLITTPRILIRYQLTP